MTMNSVTISLIVFACVIGGALIGLLLGKVLPPNHLSSDSKDVVKVGMGLVGTMTAILLGLLVASAKSFYDTQNDELTEISAKVILLDRVLAHYGPEAKEARDLLRVAVTRLLATMCSRGGREHSPIASTPGGAEILYEKIQELSPQNDAPHSLHTQTLSIAIDLGNNA